MSDQDQPRASRSWRRTIAPAFRSVAVTMGNSIRYRSQRHDEPRFAGIGGIVDGVPGAAWRGSSRKADHELTAIDHPSVACVKCGRVEPIGVQFDNLMETSLPVPPADGVRGGCRLV